MEDGVDTLRAAHFANGRFFNPWRVSKARFSDLLPQRYLPPGVPVSAIPQHAVAVLSHNLYDHLDRFTLARLPKGIAWRVPQEALTAFRQLGASHMLPMHWGTFDLTDEAIDEADRVLERLLIAESPGFVRRVHRLAIGQRFAMDASGEADE